MVGFEGGDSYREARDNIRLLERARSLPERLLRRVQLAASTNDQNRDSTGVTERVEVLAKSARAKA